MYPKVERGVVIPTGAAFNLRAQPTESAPVLDTVSSGGKSVLRMSDGKDLHSTWSHYSQGFARNDVHRFIPYVSARHEVPFVTQIGEGADRYTGDCGTACVLMLARWALPEEHKAHTTTVDDASYELLGFRSRYQLAHASTIINALRKLGIAADAGYCGPGSPALAKGPFIQLLDYELLPNRLDRRYKGGHYVVVYGASANEVQFHDPFGRSFDTLNRDRWNSIVSFSRYNAINQGIVLL